MPLTLYFGVLLFAPAVAALLVAALGLAKRPLASVTLALAALGAVVPLVLLILLHLDLLAGVPTLITLFGGGTQQWVAAGYRADSLAFFAAYGVAVLIIPLLLWIAWRGRFSEVVDADAGATATTTRRAGMLAPEQWVGVALALAIETAALSVVFSDNVAWLGLSWIVLVALVWGLGELGSDLSGFDWKGLACMALGPVLWLAFMLTVVGRGVGTRLSDLMGASGTPVFTVLLLSIALGLAGGAYPFLGWVRRRSVITPPAGLAALALLAAPATLIVGARTYAALQDSASLWPKIGAATPPITIGIALAVIGGVTVAMCGLLALGFRDARTLIALLTSSSVGWGLLALGIGRPISVAGLIVLLATSVFGLGAMLASMVAGGTLAPDIEPDGAGPHPFGAPQRPVLLAAWIVGAATLVGAPPLAGFAAFHMISAAAISTAQLVIPLAGFAWIGSALLALALLRAIAPAFNTSKPLAVTIIEEGASTETARAADSEVDDEANDTEHLRAEASTRSTFMTASDLPALLCALLALVVGVMPGWLLLFGGRAAAETLTQAGALDVVLKLEPLGYTVGTGQWLPGLAWIVLAVIGALFALLHRGTPRPVRPVYLAGEADDATSADEGVTSIATLANPDDAWADLSPAFDSNWTTPGVNWLVTSVDAPGELPELPAGDAAEAALDESEELPTAPTGVKDANTSASPRNSERTGGQS